MRTVEAREVEPRLRGPLRAVELAEAAVLADVAIALNLLGFILPLGYLLIILAVVPIAVLSARHRQRAVVACGVAGIIASMLVAGSGMAVNVFGCTLLGGAVGAAVRREWSVRKTVVIVTLCLWPPVSLVADGALVLLGHLRRLIGVQVVNSWRGTAKIFRWLGIDVVVRDGNSATRWLVAHWALAVPAGFLFAFLIATSVASRLARPTVRRVAIAAPVPADQEPEPPGPVGPVPVVLENVAFRYPGAARDALAGVSLTVGSSEWVAIMGRNGSGKSTLARIIAGRAPSSGTVQRPGRPGLGADGGTAVVAQRPETQVLGVRVRDDIVWGLPEGHPVEVLALLDRVGLDGLADEETSNLSGGQLQRLAVAAALARQPALLVADEPTAMVDPDGRSQLMDLLASLPAQGTSIVHITHRPAEAARADRTFLVDRGQLVSSLPTLAPVRASAPAPSSTPAIFRLAGVGHVFGRGSPWARRALADIDLQLHGGESVLVVGRNGSGKTTLAAILGGLLVPTEGTATMDGVSLDRCLASVSLSFQHARLQLMRPYVRDDVMYASGASIAAADAALAAVGLDPAEFADRRVDQLSGGEQRRAALAGLVACRPRLLVLDEPFAGLDTAGRLELTAVLADLRSETGLALAVVSHDTEGTEPFVDRVVTLDRGRLVGSAGPALPPPPVVAEPSRPRDDFHLLRVVPGDNPLRRLWAGTKLVALVAITATLSIEPGWIPVGLMAGLVALGVVVARIPFGALPRLPRWFWFAVAFGGFITAEAGGKPNVHIAHLTIGLGALDAWARVAALSVVILVGAALVSWTTPLGGVAPAIRRLLSPLRWVRLPVDEWAATIGLSFRCLPLLLDEMRTLAAARRLRAAHPRPQTDSKRRGGIVVVHDLLTAALVVGLRRAGELAEAIEARGGVGVIADEPGRVAWGDLVMLVIVTLGIAAAFVVPSL
jgi:energy-coupling factor transporter ATP-binding protein EcfA2